MEDIKEFGTTIKTDTEKAFEAVAHEFESATSSTSRSAGETSSSLSSLKIDINPKDEEAYKVFMENFDLESKKQEIASLLASNTAVHALYQQLVPNELSADEFWGRYFWKNEENAKKENSRVALLNKTKALATKMSEEEFKWDDDEEESATTQESENIEKKEDATSTIIEPQAELRPSTPLNVETKSTDELHSTADGSTTTDETVKKEEQNNVVESASDDKAEENKELADVQTEAVASKEDEDVFDWN